MSGERPCQNLASLSIGKFKINGIRNNEVGEVLRYEEQGVVLQIKLFNLNNLVIMDMPETDILSLDCLIQLHFNLEARFIILLVNIV